jgi:hypothetical protein
VTSYSRAQPGASRRPETLAMKRMGRTLILVAALGSVWPAMAQPEPKEPPDEQDVLSGLDRLGKEFEKLGTWEEQVPELTRAVEDVWARAGWNTESDLFARSVATEVAAIPPWQIDRRIDKVVERISDRYELADLARSRLKQSIYRETMGMLWDNAGELFDQAGQWIRMSANGEPVTPELVAEWTRQSEPLMEDFRRRSGTFIEEFGQTVDDRHRALFERDMASYKRRVEYFEQQRQRWAKGEWKPEDWGMKDGLLFRKRPAAARPTSRPAAGVARQAGQVLPYDPATWHRYVRDFVNRYELDSAQSAAAYSILAEVVQRASTYLKARAAELEQVRPEQRATHQGFAPVRSLFEELRTRLDRIPRTGQREPPSS